MVCVACCSKKKSILFLVAPRALCVNFLLIAAANSLVLVIVVWRFKSKNTTIQQKSNNSFLSAPNLRILDFFWHGTQPNPPTPAKQKNSNSLRPSGQTDLLRARAPEPHGGCAAAPGRRPAWPPRGCHRGRWSRLLGAAVDATRVASTELRKLREKSVKKCVKLDMMIVRANLSFWIFLGNL